MYFTVQECPGAPQGGVSYLFYHAGGPMDPPQGFVSYVFCRAGGPRDPPQGSVSYVFYRVKEADSARGVLGMNFLAGSWGGRHKLVRV